MTKKFKPIVRKVVKVTVTPAGRTERELSGEELEKWLKEHGYTEDKDDNSAVRP